MFRVLRRPLLGVLGTCLATPLLVPAAAQEQSVNPGINQSFDAPDVGQYVERFEKEGREVFDRRFEIVQACQLRPGMVVGDVGAGTGLFTRLFAAQVGPAGHVHAVDISDEFVDHIRQNCERDGIRNVTAILGAADDVRLPEDSVDLVFICDTYHHFEFPHKTMRSIHRALKPGGTVLVIDFRRVEGVSSDWILNHVRAGEETFTQEIKEAGFEPIESLDLLKENYVLRFRKVVAGANGQELHSGTARQ